MKTSVLFCLLLACVVVQGQSLTGWWTGAITRDYETEIKTDSIIFYLEQQGHKITGYSMLYVDSLHYIKAEISGEYPGSNQILRLTETSIIEKNIPDRGEEIFLDRYLLNFAENEMNELTGKSIPFDNRQKYARSKIIVRRK